MPARFAAAFPAVAFLVIGGVAACAFAGSAADLQVGDCLRFGGTPDLPEVETVACGSEESSYRVVQKVADSAQCPADVDSYFSMSAGDTSTTVCMDIDWVVGECMAIDTEGDSDPRRVYCYDSSVEGKQRAYEILTGVADVDECTNGEGYAYDQRNFTVCVDDMP
ncbi:MAG: LppU family putative lipoprotein [Mycobacterium sp.]|jgi:hypothetical protein